MGYDPTRFQGPVDPELLCPICAGVLEDPIQISVCEHVFCTSCMQQWATENSTCPVDGVHLENMELCKVPRLLRTLLSRLKIHCDYANAGCEEVLSLDFLANHVSQCPWDPSKPMQCASGCGLTVAANEVEQHNCVQALHEIIKKQGDELLEIRKELRWHSDMVAELKLRMKFSEECMSALCVGNAHWRFIYLRVEMQQLNRWACDLRQARILLWHALLSNPTTDLVFKIRRALLSSNCPPSIMEKLLKRCSEQFWPPTLNNADARDINSRLFAKYYCRHVPDTQAVVVLLRDNRSLAKVAMCDPGFLIIFSSGVFELPQMFA